MFDENGDGQISRKEMSEMMAKLGQTITDDELDNIFQAADKDGLGLIVCLGSTNYT